MARDTAAAPPALTHGLTSRWLFASLQEEVDELADVLMGSSPRLPDILEAARRAAEAILRLRQVRTMITHTLNQAEACSGTDFAANETLRDLSRASRQGTGDLGERGATKSGNAADRAMMRFFERQEKLLHRLDEYERRALSQRSRAIRELDLARIEAERRRLG